VAGELNGRTIPRVQVITDHPVRACLASQYAGWALQEGKFFAMGSGPMRAAAGTEALYDRIGYRESADAIVGVLETRKVPPPASWGKTPQDGGAGPRGARWRRAPPAGSGGGVKSLAGSARRRFHNSPS